MTPSAESAMSTGASSCPVQGLQMLPLVTPIHSTAKESVWLARPTATTIKPKGGTWNWWIWVKVYDEWRQLKCKWKCKITVTLPTLRKKEKKKKKITSAKVERTHILISLVGYISLYFSLENTSERNSSYLPLSIDGYINLTFIEVFTFSHICWQNADTQNSSGRNRTWRWSKALFQPHQRRRPAPHTWRQA